MNWSDNFTMEFAYFDKEVKRKNKGKQYARPFYDKIRVDIPIVYKPIMQRTFTNQPQETTPITNFIPKSAL